MTRNGASNVEASIVAPGQAHELGYFLYVNNQAGLFQAFAELNYDVCPAGKDPGLGAPLSKQGDGFIARRGRLVFEVSLGSLPLIYFLSTFRSSEGRGINEWIAPSLSSSQLHDHG